MLEKKCSIPPLKKQKYRDKYNNLKSKKTLSNYIVD